MWLSPPSPWIGSAMKQAMSCGYRSNAARAWASALASARSTSSRWSASGNRTAGTSILGQSNLGNRSVLPGSVLVSDSV